VFWDQVVERVDFKQGKVPQTLAWGGGGLQRGKNLSHQKKGLQWSESRKQKETSPSMKYTGGWRYEQKKKTKNELIWEKIGLRGVERTTMN